MVNGFSHLALTSFRNYREASIDTGLDRGLGAIVLTGLNGAGKTNLLEALSFLAPGSGLRQAAIAEVEFRQHSNLAAGTQSGAQPGIMAWAVHARYLCNGGEHALGTGRDPLALAQSGRERRISRVNGANLRSQAGFAEIVNVLWLTPQMDRLFSETTSSRRRFLDRLVYGLDPTHATRVGAYEQAMRERARILRGEAPAAASGDLSAWLGGLESEMAGQAIAIAAARLDAASQLNAAMAAAIGPFPQAVLEIAGNVEISLTEMTALEAEENLKRRLAETRSSDAESGITQCGTHRSDLVVTLAGRQLGGVPLKAGDCSTGEQKALLITIMLCHAQLLRHWRGAAPVLLLDDIAAHLDGARRAALYDWLRQTGSQFWLSGTEPALFAGLQDTAQFFQVQQGVRPLA